VDDPAVFRRKKRRVAVERQKDEILDLEKTCFGTESVKHHRVDKVDLPVILSGLFLGLVLRFGNKSKTV